MLFRSLYRLKAFRRGGLWKALRDAAEAAGPAPGDPALGFASSTLTRLRSLAGRVPAGPLLRLAVEETGYWAVLAAAPRGEQAMANVEKLISLVRGEAGPLGPVVRRLRRLLSGADRESQAALAVEGREGVRVMTVHASKGLEFPLVAVADLGQATRSSASSSLYLGLLDGEPRMHLAPSVAGRLPGDDRSVVRWRLGRAAADQRSAEEARLLYVACTRARDALILAATLGAGRRPGGRRPVDMLRDPLALGWSEGQVAATLGASEVGADSLPPGLRISVRSALSRPTV